MTSGCKIVTSKTSCSVRVSWFAHNASEVHYTADLDLPPDSISVQMDRRVTTWSAVYATRRFLIYTCQPTNTTPCNTAENVKRAIESTIFPTEEQIQKFDILIAPTTEFFGYSCSQSSTTTNCPTTNLASCQQCWGIMEYADRVDTCAVCPAGKALANFIEYSTTFLLNNQTRSDTIKLGCRRFGPCNSVDSLTQIKNTLTTRFDFGQLFTSSASTVQFSMITLCFIVLLNR